MKQTNTMEGKKIVKKCTKCRDRGLAWFHEPKGFHCKYCGQVGYMSIYGDGCTSCSNIRRINNGEIKL